MSRADSNDNTVDCGLRVGNSSRVSDWLDLFHTA